MVNTDAPRLSFVDGKIRLDVGIRYMDRAAAVPGLHARKDDDGVDYWEAYPGWATICALGKEFRDIPGFTAEAELNTVLDYWMGREEYARFIKGGGTPADSGPFSPNMYDFQPAGSNWLSEMERACLCDEMGTGKTVMALQALESVDSYPALVVAPTSMVFEWANEAAIWAPGANAYPIAGTPSQKKKAIDLAAQDDHALVIVGWGTLRTLTKLSWYGGAKALTAKEKSDGPLQAIYWMTVIADEVHRIKDPSSKQSMALKGVSRNVRWKWGLTGTALSNQPGDVWSIFNWLDPEEWTSIHDFYQRYVMSIETNWGDKPIAWLRETRDEVDRHLQRYFFRRTKDEVLPHLPKKTYQTRYVEMAGAQKTTYRKLHKDGIALLGDDALVATDPLSLRTRLSQAASATPVLEDGEVTALTTPSNKLSALHEILDELDENKSVVVFAESRKLLELVAESFQKTTTKQTYIEINGGVTAEARSGNIATFQTGNARVALVTLGAGAEGITLTEADTAVFLQRSYSMVKNLQAEDRIHRSGQESDKVEIIDVVSRGTIDLEVIAAAGWKEALLHDTLKDVGQLHSTLKDIA